MAQHEHLVYLELRSFMSARFVPSIMAATYFVCARFITLDLLSNGCLHDYRLGAAISKYFQFNNGALATWTQYLWLLGFEG